MTTVRAVLAAVASAAFALLAIASCTPRPSATAPPTVLVVAPLTGPGAALGDSSRVGMELSLEDLRAKGGAPTLAFQDSKTDPKTALSLLASRELHANARVVISEMSQVTRALVKPAEDAGVLLFATLVGVPNIGGGSKSFVRVNVMSDAIAPPVARFAAKRTQKIAVLHLNDDYGRANHELFARAFAEAKGEVTFVESFGTDPTVARTLVEKVKASGAPACFVAGYGPAYPEVFRAFKELAPGITLFADIGISNAPVFRALGAAAEGVHFAGTEMDEWPHTTTRAKEFAARFEKLRPGLRPDYVVAYSYDTIQVLAQALREVPSGDPAAIRTYLLSQRFDGLGGRFRFDSASGDSLYEDLPILVVREGKIVRVQE